MRRYSVVTDMRRANAVGLIDQDCSWNLCFEESRKQDREDPEVLANSLSVWNWRGSLEEKEICGCGELGTL